MSPAARAAAGRLRPPPTGRPLTKDGGTTIEPTQRDADSILQITAKWREHGWDGGERLAASLSILRVEAMIREQASRLLKEHELTYPRHELLSLLHFSRYGQMPMGRISERLMVHPTSVTGTVAGLEKLGFVERVPHPRDRRATLARITDAGRAAVEASAPALLGNEFGLGALSEQEAHQLFALLKKVRDAPRWAAEPEHEELSEEDYWEMPAPAE
ncbi:MarR family transcriptional regulator [Pseudonocardia sp. RS11V-5]|uniref:MarR family winged helix-turn-helix transcriptional regulator n=1 Tax=Pseudonocardia terrae TaxID=2905831 RepID=UPI001E5F9748|nr:MarR family transcriptional regulator [Pseudonocardia terrae]MCE3551388.1 MarR family transcriptional regulator [Pseudonocardia terrae]